MNIFYSADAIKSDNANVMVLSGEIRRLHVDINRVSNHELNIEKFIEWKPEANDAIYVCRGGYWHNGVFIEFNNNEESDRFFTIPEVEKMSKSKYNVQTPDELVDRFGADTLRCYEMFLGPLEQSKPWDTQGINGVSNFLRKFWRLFHNYEQFAVSDGEADKNSLKTLHKTIKKIKEDLDRFSFNTVVSAAMIAVNELTDQKCNKRDVLEKMVIILSPYAPHICEELWAKLGHKESVTFAQLPEFIPAHLEDSSYAYPVSFNGKMRFKLELPTTLSKEEIEKEVMANEQTAKYLDGKNPKKVIVVPKKIVNVVM
jgi:leucyl-tRNA synthetase